MMNHKARKKKEKKQVEKEVARLTISSLSENTYYFTLKSDHCSNNIKVSTPLIAMF